jgi:hypothetical protein
MWKLLAFSVFAAVAGAAFGWALFMLLDNGGDSTSSATSDPRTAAVLAFLTENVDKLGTTGPSGIYGVVDRSVQARCSKEQWIAAFAGKPLPSALREVKEIVYKDDGTAEVHLVLITPEGDREVVWRLSFLPNNVVKIVEIPGSEACTPP